MVVKAVVFDRGVQDGKLLQSDNGGANEERHERQPHAITLLETVFQLVAQVDDAGHVHFEEIVNVGAGAARLDHALRDDLAHLAHRDDFARHRDGRGRARRRRSRGRGSA